MANPDRKPPEVSPYVFTVLLAAFGLWCFYDGWITSNPEMQEHLLFNRIASAVLIPWAVLDFLRMRRRQRASAAEAPLTGGCEG